MKAEHDSPETLQSHLCLNFSALDENIYVWSELIYEFGCVLGLGDIDTQL